MSLSIFVLASWTQLFQYFLTSLFSISALSYSSFLAFSSLSLLFHGVKPALDTIPAEQQRANSCTYPTVFTQDSHFAEVWSLPHCLRQPYQAVDSHSACDIPTPHALSQRWYLLRYPSSAFIHTCFPFLTAGLLTYIFWIPIFLILAISAFYQDQFGLQTCPPQCPRHIGAYSPLPTVLSTLMKTTSSTGSWVKSNRTVLRAPSHLPNK